MRGQVQHAMAEGRQNPQRIERGLRVVAQILRIAEEEAGLRIVPARTSRQRQHAAREPRRLAPQAETQPAGASETLPQGSSRPASAEWRSPSPCTARQRQTRARRPTACGPRLRAAHTPAPTACRRRQKCRRGPACSAQTRWDRAPVRTTVQKATAPTPTRRMASRHTASRPSAATISTASRVTSG